MINFLMVMFPVLIPPIVEYRLYVFHHWYNGLLQTIQIPFLYKFMFSVIIKMHKIVCE